MDNNTYPAITHFGGNYYWLSNFSPARVYLDGTCYPTVEHGYQAAKTTDPARRAEIAVCARPGQAKRLGRLVPLRPNWEDLKLAAMEGLLRQKFLVGTPLGDRLLATGDADLIEGNHWGDQFWGVYNGEGENHLGQILMQIRWELIER